VIGEIVRGFHGKERIERMVQNISGFSQRSIPRNPRTSFSERSSYVLIISIIGRGGRHFLAPDEIDSVLPVNPEPHKERASPCPRGAGRLVYFYEPFRLCSVGLPP
jgi:hypothetical protein